MDDVARRRLEAWAGVGDEVVARPPTAGDVALVLRKYPAMVRRTRETRASAGMARQALGRVCRVLDRRAADRERVELVRVWASCVDEILALAERFCGDLIEERAAA